MTHLSSCCKAPVLFNNNNNLLQYKCSQCSQPCTIYEANVDTPQSVGNPDEPLSAVGGILERFEKKFWEAMGTETDPNGTENMYLIRDENEDILNGIDFDDEKNEIKDFLRSELTTLMKEVETAIGEEEPNASVSEYYSGINTEKARIRLHLKSKGFIK